MGLAVDPVPSDAALPDRSDVVVVGGGIAGVSTALFLAEKGISVTLCEKGHIAGEQSSRNWGWCRQMGRDAAEIPLSVGEPAALGRHGSQRVEGRDRASASAGIVYVCDTRKDVDTAEYEPWIEQAQAVPDRQHGCMTAGGGGAACCRARRGAGPGAAYTASDGRAEPQKAAIRHGRRRLGARGPPMLDRAARCVGIETAAGRVAGAVTERGADRLRLPWCWRGAPGRGCSAATPGWTCRS